MWDLPEPGLEPVSPALAGGFLTTAPPGKPPIFSTINMHKSLAPLADILTGGHMGCGGHPELICLAWGYS